MLCTLEILVEETEYLSFFFFSVFSLWFIGNKDKDPSSKGKYGLYVDSLCYICADLGV